MVPPAKKVEQYNHLKERHADTILLFKVEDDYEAYQDDAIKVGESWLKRGYLSTDNLSWAQNLQFLSLQILRFLQFALPLQPISNGMELASAW